MDWIELMIPYMTKYSIFKLQHCSKKMASMNCINKYWHLRYQNITTVGEKLYHKHQFSMKCLDYKSFMEVNADLRDKIKDGFELFTIYKSRFHSLHKKVIEGTSRIKCKYPHHYQYKIIYDEKQNYLQLYLEEKSQQITKYEQEDDLENEIKKLEEEVSRTTTYLDKLLDKIDVKKKKLKYINHINTCLIEKLKKEKRCISCYKTGKNKGKICGRKVKKNEIICSYHNKK